MRRTNSWSAVTPWCVAKRIPDAFLGRFPAAYVPGNAIAFFAVAGGRFSPVDVSRCGSLSSRRYWSAVPRTSRFRRISIHDIDILTRWIAQDGGRNATLSALPLKRVDSSVDNASSSSYGGDDWPGAMRRARWFNELMCARR